MLTILKIFSLIGLLLTIVPAFLVFSGTIIIESHYTLMLIGTVVWFLSAPFWMLRKKAN
ncbi:hypothetical protein JXA70_14045 [candidate division KSB1 bacterium]|nr:hypothetical protein [candidate division KSB1 bacterium]